LRVRVLSLLVALAASVVAAPAYAQDDAPPAEPPPEPTEPSPPPLALTPPELVAPPDRPRALRPPSTWLADPTLADAIVIGAGSAAAIASAIVAPQSKHWVGGRLFDEDVRDAIRLKTLDGRYRIRDASDVGLSLAVTWPFFIDALYTAWYVRDDPALARRLATVDAEAMVIIGAVQEATTGLASRERPYARDCGTAIPEKSADCDGSVRYRSFFSGHSALSFASASLVCVNHLGAELLGAPWDALSCVSAYAVATTTATFRVMGDMHYATDVITGALAGTLVGVGIPLLHHRSAPETKENALHVNLVPVAGGLGVGGVF
jgi:membrane-associated phospholipid phosphatase